MLPERAYDQLNARYNGKWGLRRRDLYAIGHVCEWSALKEVASPGEAGSGKSLIIRDLILKSQQNHDG